MSNHFANQFTLYDFSQDVLLDGNPDPEARKGVCVALCDFWLKNIMDNVSEPPPRRLIQLEGEFDAIVQYQGRYRQARNPADPFQARQQAARSLGLNYEEQTTIMRAPQGRAMIPGLAGTRGIREKLATDLERPFNGSTWSLRGPPSREYPRGWGHAIAGFTSMRSETANMHTKTVHVFDPNFGEYAGDYVSLEAILADLFGKADFYAHVTEVRRVTE